MHRIDDELRLSETQVNLFDKFDYLLATTQLVVDSFGIKATMADNPINNDENGYVCVPYRKNGGLFTRSTQCQVIIHTHSCSNQLRFSVSEPASRNLSRPHALQMILNTLTSKPGQLRSRFYEDSDLKIIIPEGERPIMLGDKIPLYGLSFCFDHPDSAAENGMTGDIKFGYYPNIYDPDSKIEWVRSF